ncbi:receptor-type tyrosine-protein phosphatase kappa-like isoform X3 [Lethenteron reissneri]|uniref:receptor-type tyrosine-protein phosphatase kappa-like isoform X3 n=1 Tax=Lethenteron reissneri TaxID=7753 RepID=UPI002AB65521|nr:receptor-type tyrosine-protein phosphatase kappa-like isoform X3 [Lethenteron reissneri]
MEPDQHHQQQHQQQQHHHHRRHHRRLLLVLLLCGSCVSSASSARPHFAGSCSFENDLATCGYSQDKDDDFDWLQTGGHDLTVEAGLPSGRFAFVPLAGKPEGSRGRLAVPPLRENDTHCVDFSFHLSAGGASSSSSSPAALAPALNVYARVNGRALAGPVWNSSQATGRGWVRAEIAVSTFWPNSYQVVFEAVAGSSGAGFVAVDDVQVLSYPCNKAPHFLRLGNVEVNAGQNATFQCIATGRNSGPTRLALQRSNGEDVPITSTKMVNHRRFSASFDIRRARKRDADKYRCVVRSPDGSGVSNFAELFVKEPPAPVAPPQLLGVGATYLWIALNANSILGDGPIVVKEVEYRMPQGAWAEIHPVDTATYKLWQLDPDTHYEVRVRLTRPGEGGAGRPGPPLIARTKCAEPTRAPGQLEVYNVKPRQLSVEWEALGYNVTRCYRYNITARYRYARRAPLPSPGAGTAALGAHAEEVTLEEVWMGDDDSVTMMTLHDLPPFTNVSLRLVLSNSEGRKQSEEITAQTTEDVPSPVTLQSLKAQSFEEKLQVQWGEPSESNGVITLYEVSYRGVSSFDGAFDASSHGGKVYKSGGEHRHLFVGLHPGTRYAVTVRASTSRGFGLPTTTHFSTNISAPSMPDYDSSRPLEETETTITVLLKPATAKGAPVSVYQLVVEETASRRRRSHELPPLQRQRRAPRRSGGCFLRPTAYPPGPDGADAPAGAAPRHYFAAELPPGSLQVPTPFTVGDNATYGSFWNPPLDPGKSYDVYFQAVSEAGGEVKIDCVKVASKGLSAQSRLSPTSTNKGSGGKRLTVAAFTRAPAAPVPEQRAQHTVRVAGIVAGAVLTVALLLVLVLFLKRRRTAYSYAHYLKLAKKRGGGGGGGSGGGGGRRQEMTLMVNAMDKSYAEQSTILPEEPFAFLNAHGTSSNASASRSHTPSHTAESLAANHRSPKPSSSSCPDDGCGGGPLVEASGSQGPPGPAPPYPHHGQPPIPQQLPPPGGGGGGHGARAPHCHGTGGGQRGPRASCPAWRGPERVPESPYHTGQLHPAIRVNDLLQHIEQMKLGEGYGFKEEYESFFEGQSASWTVAKREENRPKNRYGNIIAYDHSRVVLQPTNGDPSSDYINANYIDGYHRTHHYIATQGPLPETVYDFWRMVWQEHSASVVMLTNLVEVGRVKCCKYWADECEVYNDVKVTLVATEMLAEYIIRTFSIERAGCPEVREVRHFHFTSWPDHGVPYHATGLLAFVRRVKALNPPDAGPCVVHCSAGAGRTGCFMVIDITLDMAEKEGVVDIYNCVQELRSRRVNTVQTEEQYVFIHDAMLEACLCGDTAIPAPDFRAAYCDLLRLEPQSSSNHVKDEFQTLHMVTPPLRAEDCSIALLPRNHDKNRFRDFLPPDRCLPFLIAMDGDSSNYVNAALLDSYSQPSAFIATQHPLPNSVKDFWRLVFDYHCTAIVMLNELDPTQLCPQYWPEEGLLRHGPIQVEFAGCFLDGDITNRTFRICNVTRPQDGYRTVQHFQYAGWALRKDVPASRRSFLHLAAQVEKWQQEYGAEGRVLAHCLNGSGRTGLFCAATNVCEMIRRQNAVDVFCVVKALRNNKANMVDSLSQYQFCYDIALEYLESG